MLVGGVILAVILGAAAVTVYGDTVTGSTTDTGTVNGHFDYFGQELVSGDDFDMTEVTWDEDGDQATDGNGTTDYQQNSVSNESVQTASDASDNGWINLANEDIDSNSVTVWNQTANSVISTSNYNMNLTDGAIKLDSAVEATNTEVTIDYDWMPDFDGKRRAEISFEIDKTVRGATLATDIVTANAVTDDTFDIVEAEIQDEETGDVVQTLDHHDMDNENEVQIQSLTEGEYELVIWIEHSPAFEPNRVAGTTEDMARLDMTLDTDHDGDDPVEVEDFALVANSISP